MVWSFSLKAGTAQDQMFLNFGISHRSAIRRAPSVVTWVQVLQKLKVAGSGTWTQVVKEWNSKAAKTNQLTGQKAVAVKLLMDSTPSEVFAKISEHTSKWGWAASAFSDECLAQRKAMPGSKIKFDCGVTTAVSAESMLLMFKLINKEWDERLPHMRRKFTKKDMEERVEWSTMAVYIRDEAARATLLTKDEIDNTLLHEFEDNNTQLILEIQSAMVSATKPDQISVIRDQLVKRSSSTAASARLDMETQQSLTNSLEDCNFTVAMKQLESDSKALRIHQQKQSSYESAVYWRELDWRREQYQFYEAKATKFFHDHVHLQSIQAPIADIIRKFSQFKNDISHKLSKTVADVVSRVLPNAS